VSFWAPGSAYPPVPNRASKWLQNEQEETAPLLILSFNKLNNPSSAPAASQPIIQPTNPSSNQVLIGQYVTDQPPSRIPKEALVYFPRDLAKILSNQSNDQINEESNRPRNRSNRRANDQQAGRNQPNDQPSNQPSSPADIPSSSQSNNRSVFGRLFSRSRSNNPANIGIDMRVSLLSDDERKENDVL
jgi:hypothetical protein